MIEFRSSQIYSTPYVLMEYVGLYESTTWGQTFLSSIAGKQVEAFATLEEALNYLLTLSGDMAPVRLFASNKKIDNVFKV